MLTEDRLCKDFFADLPKVTTLVAEKLPAGKHQRVWEAKGLASGAYLYRIEADEFVQSRKLVLLR